MSTTCSTMNGVPADEFHDPRLTAMGVFVEAFKGVSDKVGEVHARNGLSGVDFDALIGLARSPQRQLRMSELAAQAGLSTSGVTRIVDRLERTGLVRRQPSPGDRRGSLTVLTDTGQNRLRAELPELVEVIERWFTGLLTEDQLHALIGAMHTVRQAVRPGAIAGATGSPAVQRIGAD